MSELGPLPRRRKTGGESFHHNGVRLPYDLLDFWRWSNSDLVSNTLRGVLAEYIVAQALGLARDQSREEWAPYDLTTSGGITIEVKSAAYIQSWHQDQHSKIVFSCPKTRVWDYMTGLWEDQPRRQAQVYVFALLAHQEQTSLDPMDLSQWEFYVLPTAVLNAREGSPNSITLSSLQALHGEPVGFQGLLEAVVKASSSPAQPERRSG